MQEHGRYEPEQLARLNERRACMAPCPARAWGCRARPPCAPRPAAIWPPRPRIYDHIERDEHERHQAEPVALERACSRSSCASLLVVDGGPQARRRVVHLVEHGRLLAGFRSTKSRTAPSPSMPKEARGPPSPRQHQGAPPYVHAPAAASSSAARDAHFSSGSASCSGPPGSCQGGQRCVPYRPDPRRPERHALVFQQLPLRLGRRT